MHNPPESMLRSYYAAWASGDPYQISAFFAPQGALIDYGIGGTYDTPEAIEAFAAQTFTAFPDFRVEIVELFIADQAAGSAWIMHGHHRGDLPGLPASGREFKLNASSIIRMHGGAILRMADYWNMEELKRQLSA